MVETKTRTSLVCLAKTQVCYFVILSYISVIPEVLAIKGQISIHVKA
jgi:hypothetical protein